jgi:predicted lipoprotein
MNDSSETPDRVDNFNRTEMLTYWADHIIIPSMANYNNALISFVEAKNNFIANPDQSSLDTLRSGWLSAYKAWQHISMFDIGKAEELGLRNFVNIYPTDTSEIHEFIESNQYNLNLPSTFDAQGFPALDYLLFGLSEDDTELINQLSIQKYSQYLSNLVDRLFSLSEQVLLDWQQNYRNIYVQNNGSAATASTDKTVNDFLFYYEKYFRAGKIGIPAGVFTGNPLSHAVEAPYSGVYSKELFQEAFTAIKKFYAGSSFDETQNGPSIQQYLEHVQTLNQLPDISEDILSQWEKIELSAQDLNDNFREQVDFNNLQMLITYDEIQKAVILLKVDMMQALNIQVDFVDADGD